MDSRVPPGILDATVPFIPGDTATHHALLACQSQRMEPKCCKKDDNENRRIAEETPALTYSLQVMDSTENTTTIPSCYDILFKNIIQNLTDSEARLDKGPTSNQDLCSSSELLPPETETSSTEASGTLKPENSSSLEFPETPNGHFALPHQMQTVHTNYNSSIDHLAKINNILCELFCHQQRSIMNKSPEQDGFLEIFNYAAGIFPSFRNNNLGINLPATFSGASGTNSTLSLATPNYSVPTGSRQDPTVTQLNTVIPFDAASTYSIPSFPGLQFSLNAFFPNVSIPTGSRQDPTVTLPVTVLCPQPLPQGSIPKFLKDDASHFSECNNRLKELVELNNFKRQTLFTKLMCSMKRKERPARKVLKKRRKRVKTVSPGDSAPQQVSVDTSLPTSPLLCTDQEIRQPLANHQQNTITAITVLNKLSFVPKEARDLRTPPMSPTSPELTTLIPIKQPKTPHKKTSKPRKMAKTGRVKESKERTPSTDEEEDEPQMSTPDDPVIHSPPSLGGYGGGVPKMEDGMNPNCASPDGASLDPNSESERRRQKTCRVCGDHATGYNFNVITCESCKAFFRRNALRPKEFKCPYSEDCEINAVSRRFCQKCRLRKCFAVGMKKEWILNEEQLRRRKNSRLNNLQTQQRSKHTHDMVRQHQSQMVISPKSITAPMEAQLGALNGRGGQPLISPSGGGFQYPLMSPPGSAQSDSPPRSMQMMQGQRSPDAYDPNVLMNQRMQQQHQQMSRPGSTTSPPNGADGSKRAYSPNELASPQPRSFGNPAINAGGQPMMRQTSGVSYVDMDSPAVPQTTSPQYGATLRNFNNYFQQHNMDQSAYIARTIEDALKVDSPDSTGSVGSYEPVIHRSDVRIAYQLNAAELRAIDMVADAFKGLNDPVEAGRQRTSFLKDDKEPADVMNVMDVAMRRLVKMAKKLPTFNEMSQEGKFSLLKASMIEMLTLRGVTRFDPKTGSFRSPTLAGAEVSINFFEKLNKNFSEERKRGFLRFFSHFTEEIRSNDIATSIIMLIVLFSARDDVISDENDRKLILKFHEQYRALFTRYIESLYGDGSTRLTEGIPVILAELKEIAENSAYLFLGTLGGSANEAEALPREIFKVE